MPKGVDHWYAGKWTALEVKVQKSLMPKGVDHLLNDDPTMFTLSAKIFDAERR